MNKQPLFSIIVPVYNKSATLPRCLSSIFSQSTSDFEIIIVDDGSTDNSCIVAKELLEVKREIHYRIVKQKNQGAGSARNTGVEIANGQYIVFLDADDYLDKQYLYYISTTIEESSPDVVFVEVIRENEDGTILRIESMTRYRTLPKDQFIRAQLTGKIPWGGVRKIVKSSVLLENNIRFSELKVGEECIYSFCLMVACKNVSFQENAIYHYVANNNSLTAKDDLSNAQRVFESVCSHFEKYRLLDEYRPTLNSFSVTTALININLLAKTHSIKDSTRIGREIIKKYQHWIKGKLDWKSMETRVALCAPLIRYYLVTPVVLIARIKYLIKR